MNIDLEKLKALKTLGVDLNDTERVERFFTQTEPEPKPKQEPEPEPKQEPESKPKQEPNFEFNKTVIESINKLTEALQASNRLNINQPTTTGESLEDIANYIINGKVDNNNG